MKACREGAESSAAMTIFLLRLREMAGEGTSAEDNGELPGSVVAGSRAIARLPPLNDETGGMIHEPRGPPRP